MSGPRVLQLGRFETTRTTINPGDVRGPIENQSYRRFLYWTHRFRQVDRYPSHWRLGLPHLGLPHTSCFSELFGVQFSEHGNAGACWVVAGLFGARSSSSASPGTKDLRDMGRQPQISHEARSGAEHLVPPRLLLICRIVMQLSGTSNMQMQTGSRPRGVVTVSNLVEDVEVMISLRCTLPWKHNGEDDW